MTKPEDADNRSQQPAEQQVVGGDSLGLIQSVGSNCSYSGESIHG